jgi:hypothetical protein
VIAAVFLGTALAIVNVVVIGFAFTLLFLHPAAFLMVGVEAMPFAVPAGFTLGLVAHLMRSMRPLARSIALTMPALVLVGWLGGRYRLDELVIFASVPTFVFVLVLERYTRDVPDALPRAIARPA